MAAPATTTSAAVLATTSSSGEAGADLLEGGFNLDPLYGGADNDRFIFRATSDSAVGATRDVIYDLDDYGNDYIDLSLMPGVTTFIGTATFTAAGQVRAVQSGAHVLIQINTSGTSAPSPRSWSPTPRSVTVPARSGPTTSSSRLYLRRARLIGRAASLRSDRRLKDWWARTDSNRGPAD